MQKLRGALIGYGFIMEKGHAAGYQQRGAGPGDVEIVAIADISPAQRAIAQATWPKARLYEDAPALLAAESDKIDFVDIATPPSDHAEIALAGARRAGCTSCAKSRWPRRSKRRDRCCARRSSRSG